MNSFKKTKNKQKTLKVKNKVKKRKTRVTREYQENEIEVQRLLEDAKLSLDWSGTPSRTTTSISNNKQKLKNNLTDSVEFFCKSSDDKRAKKEGHRRSSVEESERNIQNLAAEDERSLQTDEELDDTDNSVSLIASMKHDSPQSTITAASLMRIELKDLPVINSQRIKDTIQFDNNLLYSPESVLDINIRKYITGDLSSVKANTARLLNRYYMENTKTIKRFRDIAENFKTGADEEQRYVSDKTLRRTLCDHEFRPIFCEPTTEVNALPTSKFIKLHLKELRFTEHELLQPEHCLANKLLDFYQAYAERFKLNVCEKLDAALRAERKVVNDLLKREALDGAQETDMKSQAERAAVLAEHLQSVRQHRTQLYQAEAENKRLLRQVLKIWMQLKKLREEQGYQCTRFRLRIRVRNEEGVTELKRAWQQRYANDLNEMMREQLENYYSAKRTWKQYRQHNSGSGADGVNLKRPRKPNAEKLARSLKRQLIESIGQPGEPKVDIFFNRLSDEDFYELCSSSWHSSCGHSYYMKLFFDEQFVGMTRTYRLEPDLQLASNESIGIFLERRLPRNIKIALYEKPKLPKLPTKIANIIVPLPLGSDAMDFQTQSISFSSHKQATSGRLELRFECDETIYPDDMVKVLFPPPKERITISKEVIQKDNNNRLIRCLKETRRNQHEACVEDELKVVVVNDEKRNNNHRSHLHTCTFQEDLLKFCSMNELESNKRFRLLRSRFEKKDSNTKDLRFIPSLDHELMNEGNEDPEEAVIDAGNWMDPIDVQKHEGKKHVKIVYEALSNQCARLSKITQNSENLLIDDEPPTIGTFIKAISNLLMPSRPLNPIGNKSILTAESKHSFEELHHNPSNQNFTIIMNVVRATGIPIRNSPPNAMDSNNRQFSGSSAIKFLPQQSFKYSNVRPFIALSYRDKFCRTMTADGSSPTWNEDLQLHFNGNLKTLRDDIKILLFDEVIENHINDDIATHDMDIYQRIQTNWLGEYRIPITTLLRHTKIEGVFELNIPKVLFGYRQPSFDGIAASVPDTSIAIEQLPEVKECVHLWFYISLKPALDLPHFGTSCLECSELREVHHRLKEWSMNVREIQPKRFFDPLVCTADGKRVCITRLLEPVPLPIEANGNLLDTACRYVSLLNVLKGFDAKVPADFDGVWLKNETLLDTTWGSAKDLGILLANFMLSLGISCQVVLCSSHPHGQGAFVLYYSNEQESLILLDPCSGRRYCVNDTFCPIAKVDGIVSRDNIYFNIQTETRLAMTNFNISDSACWTPAFNKRNPAPLGGIQKLNYAFAQCLPTEQLCKNIERKIIKKISSWRAMRKTVWNRAFQKRLHNILILLEKQSLSARNDNENEAFKYAKELATELPNYTLYGFTLNFSYTNLSSISERVKSTGIHLNSNKDVQFSLAVHIHSYTNNVLSVWIFLMSLIPNANV